MGCEPVVARPVLRVASPQTRKDQKDLEYLPSTRRRCISPRVAVVTAAVIAKG
jgi:hypothetical protein